jgi:hypothetical protein
MTVAVLDACVLYPAARARRCCRAPSRPEKDGDRVARGEQDRPQAKHQAGQKPRTSEG